jgi:hypothetical protein
MVIMVEKERLTLSRWDSNPGRALVTRSLDGAADTTVAKIAAAAKQIFIALFFGIPNSE